jgi:hypothetical protein
MVAPLIGTSASKARPFSPRSSAAAQLGPAQRADLSVQALAGSESVTHLAARHNVSRNFIYRQAAKAADAIDQAFTPPVPDDGVLFYLPVTKPWLRQFVLAQVLIGHTSFRGVTEILDAVFDYRDISIGTVHNILADTVDTARRINDAQDLSAIAVGAHDEIYQARRPVLVGADVRSTYCYLLSAEDICDETTWGVHLLDLRDRGLRPRRTIADGGKALRAGQAAAWGDEIPCNGDVFHAERDLGGLASYLDHRAAGCTTTRRKLEGKMLRARKRAKGQRLSKKLALARQAEAKAVALARDVRILSDWMQNDILSLAGADLSTRRELFDFVTEELRWREGLCPHRIGPVRRMLEGRREDLLAFAGILDERLADVALRRKVSPQLTHAVCELLGTDPKQPAYWRREAQLRRELRGRFHAVQTDVRRVLAETPRASSIVENINSRLRNYFFLRRHIGNAYLDLLRFFLNHRRFLRSDRPERVGKSPRELLTARPHLHWLEMLGYERFHRN